MSRLLSNFSKVEVGDCAFCGESNILVVKPVDSTAQDFVSRGLCDLCSYALRHAWKRELGELVTATTPKVVRTQVVVARLPNGKSDLDVSSYELRVERTPGRDGDEWRLPSYDFSTPHKVIEQLNSQLSIVTWDPALHEIYLGYTSSGEFSNTLLAWAWGHTPGSKRRHDWKTFAELLAMPSPEAGYYLGLKRAFENVLWRREVTEYADTESLKASVVMGEGAIRCLDSDTDSKMSDLFRSSLSADEAEVVRLVEAARTQAEKPSVVVKASVETEVSVEEVSVEEVVEEGFARPTR